MKKMSVFLLVACLFTGSLFAMKNVWIINKGIGGNSVKDGLKRLQKDVIDVKPDWLILFFGMNDVANPAKLSSVKEYKTNLQKLIDKTKENGIGKIVLVTLNPVINDIVLSRHKNHPEKDLNARIDKFNLAIREIAAKNKIYLADFHQLVMSKGGATEKSCCLIRNVANSKSQDGVHLTPEGNQELAKLFDPIFKDKIKLGEKIVCFGDSLTYGSHVKGAGTIFGGTYPAWLSVRLNNMLGNPNLQPLAQPERDGTNYINNGNFVCTDGVYPDNWNVWNVLGKQEGEIIASKGNFQDRKSYLGVVNKNPSAPAFVTSKKMQILQGRILTVRYWIKGSGEIYPMVCQYSKGKFFKTFVETQAQDRKWKKADNEWTEYSFNFKPDDKTQKIMTGFRVKGKVFIKSASARMGEEKKESGKFFHGLRSL